MTSDLAGQWLLIETIGDEPTVIGVGDRVRELRRISNMFRGAARTAIDGLIKEATKARSPVTQAVAAQVDEQLGGPFGIAVPTLGPSGEVQAVQVWFGQADAQPEPPEPLGVWEWELGLEDRPPRLQLTETALDILGVDKKFRDRSVYGPADYFTRIEKISDLLDLDQKVKTAAPGNEAHGSVLIRPDGGGALRRMYYAQRCVSTPSGPRLRGVCRDISRVDDPGQIRVDLLEHTLVDILLKESGMYAVIGDVTFPAAPYIMKWLTPHPAGVGHGVSTGQTPGIHPEDLPKVAGWIYEIRQTGGPVSGRARTRAAGGGWIEGDFIGMLLDPVLSKTIAVGIVIPGSITIEEPETSR
ncbi:MULTISPECIES: GAF domain-containing protein [unclassified Nocardia]|uniref:GAF domain-containing protein n=1 Tax=unclassified Nocardia TaxID=2637762 RepID=UPI001CE4838F|nr:MULTISPECIES: GAF domain-containing protein [unclassified Nocardia]